MSVVSKRSDKRTVLASVSCVVAGVMGICVGGAGAAPVPDLYAPGRAFANDDPIVSTTVFHWYSPTPHQWRGPWRPLEGLAAWDGSTAWWKTQVKQTMAANIDVFYVHLIDSFEPQRVNLFQALHDLLLEYESLAGPIEVGDAFTTDFLPED